MNQATESALADPQQLIANLQQQFDERTAERDALRGELADSREQQSATREILSVISRSPSDIRPVFEAIVARAAQLCEAEPSSVFRFEDGRLHLVAVHSLSPEEAAAVHSVFPRPPARNFITGRAFLDIRPVQIEDVLAEPDYDAPIREGPQSVIGFRSALGVPICRDGRPIGVIGCFRREVKPFTPAQLELVKTFADQAVIATENARLLSELQARTWDLEESLEYQTATSDVLNVISRSTSDVQPVLDTMIETAVRLCGADDATISIRDGEIYRPVSSSFSAAEPELWAALRQRTLVPGRDTVIGRVLLEGRVVHVTNVSADPDYALPETMAAGIGTCLGVPLLREGAALGTIVLSRKRVEPFTERQIELVRTFADQAVIAIENARLLTELRESLEQQTATAEVLQVINSSPGELQPVFEAILEKAHTRCGATRGTLHLFDGETFRPVAMRGLPQDWAEQLRRGISVHEASLWAPLLTGAPFVHTPDLRLIDDPVARAAAERGARTGLGLALRKDGALLGMITCNRGEVRPFSEKEIAFLQNFAAQAVIAMENARLLDELRERTCELEESLEYQTATSEVLNVISRSTADVQPVLDTVVKTATRLCDAYGGSITVREGEVYRYVASSYSASDPELWAAMHQRRIVPDRDSLAGRVALEGKVVHIEDIRADPDYAQPEPVTAGVRTQLGVPLLREGAVLGTINLGQKRVEPYTERQIQLVRTFADQAVIAIENARLLTELRESLEQQTATAEVLQVINSSPGELQPVFEAILEKARIHCGATRGTLLLFDGETFRAVAMQGFAQDRAEQLRRGISVRQATYWEPLLAGAPFVHIPDMRLIDNPVARAAADRGARTYLLLPLRKDGALLGVISCGRDEVRPFSDKEIAFLGNFAAQAVIAMENARLLGELQARTRDLEEALEYQTATSDVLNVISRSTADVQPVLDTVAETAARLCNADAAGVTMREGEVFRYVSSPRTAASSF